jgi:NADH:ubiquinone oxidoreductase subunit E
MRDVELEAYWADIRGMMETDGWRRHCKELTEQAEIINSVEATQSADDMWIRKGQLSVIATILNLEATVNAGEEAYQAELQGEDD